MSDVGDAKTVTFTATVGTTVNATTLDPDGNLVGPVLLTEDPPGNWPFTFILTSPGMWRVRGEGSGAQVFAEQMWVYARSLNYAAPLVTVEDVTVPGTTLTSVQTAQAAQLIDEATARIRLRVPSLESRLADGSLDRSLLVGAVSRAVNRVLSNVAQGIQSKTIDDYTVRYFEARAGLYVDESDLIALMPSNAASSAFTVAPTGTGPYRVPSGCSWGYW